MNTLDMYQRSTRRLPKQILAYSCSALAVVLLWCTDISAQTANQGVKDSQTVSMIDECDNVRPEQCSAVKRFMEEPGRSRKPLFLRLASSEDMETRAKLAEALGYIGGKDVRTHLQKAVDENISAKVRHAAIHALGDLKDPLALPFLERQLRGDNIATRIASANAMGRSRLPGAIPALVESIGFFHPKAKAASLDALGAIQVKTDAVELIVLEVLGNVTLPWSVHDRAMFAVEKLGIKEAGPLVLGFLNHERAEIVGRACRTLGQLEVQYANAALLNVVENDVVSGGTAALALIWAKDKKTTASINWAAMNPDLTLDVRRQFFRSMALRKQVESVLPLTTLLRSKDPQLVILSLESLGQLGAPTAGPMIRPLLEDPSDEIQSHAVWAMEQISGQKHGDRLDLWDEWLRSIENKPTGVDR